MRGKEKQVAEVVQSKILTELITKIEVYRERRPETSHYPKRVRNLILRALKKGVSSNRLGRAVGVSGRAIRYWQKSEPILRKKRSKNSTIFKSSVRPQRSEKNKPTKRILKPRELAVVSERESFSSFVSESQACAQVSVLLRSGVRIELELSALSSDFLLRLSEIGGALC